MFPIPFLVKIFLFLFVLDKGAHENFLPEEYCSVITCFELLVHLRGLGIQYMVVDGDESSSELLFFISWFIFGLILIYFNYITVTGPKVEFPPAGFLYEWWRKFWVPELLHLLYVNPAVGNSTFGRAPLLPFWSNADVIMWHACEMTNEGGGGGRVEGVIPLAPEVTTLQLRKNSLSTKVM